MEQMLKDKHALETLVRGWEKRFTTLHGHPPTDNDIHANVRIRERYKRYKDVCAMIERNSSSQITHTKIRTVDGDENMIASPMKHKVVVDESPVKQPLRRSPRKHIGSPEPRGFAARLAAQRKRAADALGKRKEPAKIKLTKKTKVDASSLKASEKQTMGLADASRLLGQIGEINNNNKNKKKLAPKILFAPEDSGKENEPMNIEKPRMKTQLGGDVFQAFSNSKAGSFSPFLNRQGSVLESRRDSDGEDDQPADDSWGPLSPMMDMPSKPRALQFRFKRVPSERKLFVDDTENVENDNAKAEADGQKSDGNNGEEKVKKKEKKKKRKVPSKEETETESKPKAKKVRHELSDNFVRTNLRQKTYRRKGGTASSRMVRDRREITKSKSVSSLRSSSSSRGSSSIPITIENRDILDKVLENLSTETENNMPSSSLFAPTNVDKPRGEPPLCSGHNLPCIIRVVKKKNKNHGREFYSCQVGRESFSRANFRRGGPPPRSFNLGCNFFQWVDDSTTNVAQTLAENVTSEAFRDSRLDAFQKQYEEMSLPQLKALLRKNGLAVGGKKADLVTRLLEHARTQVNLHSEFEQAFSNGNQQEQENRSGENAGDESEEDEDEDEDEDEEEESDCVITRALQKVFKYNSFRGDQEWAIRRVLEGKSTLLVQATGTGKSLCYQIPALLLPGLTIVISPLVSLMEDQLKSLPVAIPGACLNSQQSGVEVARTIKNLKARRIKVLFVSPERLFTSSFQRLLRTPGLLPEISLVCVDEAHCISSWSHNFRPSYLRLRELLRAGSGGGERGSDAATLNPKCVLALTATATSRVTNDICDVLGIDTNDGTMIGHFSRSNLVQEAFMIRSEERVQACVNLLSDGGTLGKPKPVIIYASTKVETEVIAEQLRSRDISARAYHGGMSSLERDLVQKGFMKGTYRVIVATLAFGMGIDKANIRGVVHVGMPRSVEDYVQEIGRAGRDGQEAYCVTYFDEVDARRLHSLSFSDGMDKESLGNFVRYLKNRMTQGNGKQVPINPNNLSMEFDIKPSVIETMLVYLSLPPFQLIKLLPSGYATGAIRVIRNEMVARVPIYHACKQFMDRDGFFDLVRVSESLEQSLAQTLRELSELQDQRVISLTLSNPSMFVQSTSHPTAWDDANEITNKLYDRLIQLEVSQTEKVEGIYRLLKMMTHKTENDKTKNKDEEEKSAPTFEMEFERYFQNKEMKDDDDEEDDDKLRIPFESILEGKNIANLLRSDIKVLLFDRTMSKFSINGRIIARILHGLESPLFPASAWKKNGAWGRYREYSFTDVLNFAEQVIKDMRLQRLEQQNATS